MDLWIIFLTGLTIGGVSCMAVQGGLLASVIAARSEEDKGRKDNPVLPVAAFLITKTVVYFLFGMLLGLFGAALSLNDTTRNILQFAAGVYMIVIALHLLNVHPIFRYALIQPPYFLTKRIRKQSRSATLFAPALLGAMTIFIPCGTTLAMEALAISSGSAIQGGLIMLVFTLGTIPAFFGLGYLTSVLGEKLRERFFRLAGVLVLMLGIWALNGVMVASGSEVNLQNLAAISPIQLGAEVNGTSEAEDAKLSGSFLDGVRSVDLQVTSRGYSPTYIAVNQGDIVRLNLKSEGVYSCASAFRIPALKIAKNLPPTGTEIVEFKAEQKGKIAYTCSMGMYSGTLEIL